MEKWKHKQAIRATHLDFHPNINWWYSDSLGIPFYSKLNFKTVQKNLHLLWNVKDTGTELTKSSNYNVAIRSEQIIWDPIVLFAPFSALILILNVILHIRMALYYTLPIKIWNKMTVKLDFLSCRGADLICRQNQRSRINSGGSSLTITVGFHMEKR